MTFAIASLITEGPVELDDAKCVVTSYPTFFQDLEKLLS
jgi:3-phosphoshikimate 1-carboxyvinyltransferase